MLQEEQDKKEKTIYVPVSVESWNNIERGNEFTILEEETVLQEDEIMSWSCRKRPFTLQKKQKTKLMKNKVSNLEGVSINFFRSFEARIRVL
jgi:hypothetical protein